MARFIGYFTPSEQVLFFCGDYGIDKPYLTFVSWKQFHEMDRVFKKFSKSTCVKIAVQMKRKINSWTGEPVHDDLVDYYFASSNIKGVPVKTTTPEEINKTKQLAFQWLDDDFRKVCGVTGDHLQGGGNLAKSKRKRRRKKRKNTKLSNDTLTKDHTPRGIEKNWSTLEAAEKVRKENGTKALIM